MLDAVKRAAILLSEKESLLLAPVVPAVAVRSNIDLRGKMQGE